MLKSGYKKIIACLYAVILLSTGNLFINHCNNISKEISHTTLTYTGTTISNRTVIIDDYRQSYAYLRNSTPPSSRILAWWDYGYHINAIANRTTLVDGNTWHHEHLALVAKILMSEEKEAWKMARHLADYVMVSPKWDLRKVGHLVGIADSVYNGFCGENCQAFGMYRFANGTVGPAPKLKNSLLYKLCQHTTDPDVRLDNSRFEEVYRSKYDKVRIYTIYNASVESKEWIADPRNRECDDWICWGRYPPAIQHVIDEKRDYKEI